MIIDDIFLFQNDLVAASGVKVCKMFAVLNGIQGHRGMYLDVAIRKKKE